MQTVHDGLISMLKSISKGGENPANILTDLLPISKEGAYRRLRGDMQLTMDEAIILAKKMGISIDNLIEVNKKEKYVFHISPFSINSSLEEYYQTLADIMASYNFLRNDAQAYSYIVGRVFSPGFYFKYKELTKYTFFKWIYQVHNQTKYTPMSDISVPAKFEQIFQPFIEATEQVPTTFILNDVMFSAIAKDLLYYFTIRLLTKEEVEILKEQILLMIDDMEYIATNGRYKNGAAVSIYIAETYFDASYHYIKGNEFEACGVGAYGLNFLSCVNNQVCNNFKVWIESLIKYSNSITQSGEIYRLAFFNEQREKIRNVIV